MRKYFTIAAHQPSSSDSNPRRQQALKDDDSDSDKRREEKTQSIAGLPTIVDLLKSNLGILGQTLLSFVGEHKGLWLLWWSHGGMMLRIHRGWYGMPVRTIATTFWMFRPGVAGSSIKRWDVEAVLEIAG